MPEKTVHGYNYRIRIWYPEAPENKTEGTILAAYEEDLANQIQTRYPGVTYEIISKEPVLGDPQLETIPVKAEGWDHGPECVCPVCRIRKQSQGKPSRLEIIRRIKPILPSAQLNMSGDLLRGEEGEHFEKVFLKLAQTFEAMPQPYQTEGTPTNDKIIHLHYFTSGSDWYIIERDSGQEQIQAYGYVILNRDLQNAEWGYVNIEEMKGYPQVELDFYWTPKTFKEVMIEKNPGAINSDNPGNPGHDELQFKTSLARAEQFMNELRRFGYDVGHDADYEDPANYMTVIVRNVTPGRKRLLLDTAKRWTAFLKEGNPQQPKCPQCNVPMTWKVNLFVCPQCQRHYDVSALQKAGIKAIPPIEGQSQGNPGNPPQVFTYSERLKAAIKEDPVVGWTHALNLWDSLTPSEKEELRMLWIYQGKEEFTRLQPNILSELFNIGEPLSDLAYLFQAIDKKILLGQSLSGNPGNPGADQNLRDRLIAEIYNNRMDAWKRGHVGVRSVSAEDLTELRSMSTPELEQTAKLTRQFLFPLKGQIQEQVEYRWEFLPIGQGHYFNADSYERAFYKALEEATRDVVIFQQWKPREQWKYALLPLQMKGWTPEQVIEHYVGQGMDRNMITKVMEGASIFHQGP